MIPLPQDITSKDIHQWLDGGWCYAEVNGVLRMAMFQKYIEPSGAMVVTDDLNGNIVPVEKVYAHWPMCGAINIMPWTHPMTPVVKLDGKHAIQLRRVQRKQWKRTYNSGCLSLVPIGAPHQRYLSPEIYGVAKCAFNPEYFSYTDVVQNKFPEGWKSCAITPSLIVTNGVTKKVFLNGELIGKIDAENLMTCTHIGLKTKLRPYFDYLVE